MKQRIVLYSKANNWQDFRASMVDKWICSIDMITLTEEDRSTRWTTLPSATLSTTNPIQSGLGSNLGLCSVNTATSCLTHGVASLYWCCIRRSFVSLCIYQYLKRLRQHYDHRPYILQFFFKINMSVFNDRNDLHLLSAFRNNQRQSERQAIV
jgi:hypothetical protein